MFTWEQRKLKEVLKTEIKGKAKLEMKGNESLYLDADFLNGGEKVYVNSPQNVENNDVLILWDGSQAGKVYHGHSGALGSTLKAFKPLYSGDFLYHFLTKNQEIIFHSYRTPNIPHVIRNFTEEFYIDLPGLEEQTKSSSFFNELDHLITLHQRKF